MCTRVIMADASLQAARTEPATLAGAAAGASSTSYGSAAGSFDIDNALDALDAKPKFTPGDTVEISGLVVTTRINPHHALVSADVSDTAARSAGCEAAQRQDGDGYQVRRVSTEAIPELFQGSF